MPSLKFADLSTARSEHPYRRQRRPQAGRQVPHRAFAKTTYKAGMRRLAYNSLRMGRPEWRYYGGLEDPPSVGSSRRRALLGLCPRARILHSLRPRVRMSGDPTDGILPPPLY